MAKLFIKIHPFTKEQMGFLSIEGEESLKVENFNLPDLAEYILSHNDVDKVTFYGNRTYLESCIQNLRKKMSSNYQDKTIDFEIKEN